MRRLFAALTVALLAFGAPTLGRADAVCTVLTDPAGDVAGPLGTPRPTRNAGAAVDLTGVAMRGGAGTLTVTMSIADLWAAPTPGAGGAIYATFWTINGTRYFAQAVRLADSWSFSAGRAADVGDAIPQQGTPVTGKPVKSSVRIHVPSVHAGSPRAGSLLQQVRTRTQETLWQAPQVTSEQPRTQPVAEMSDAAGGPEGGRFLLAGLCLPGISAAGERCLIAVDTPGDATAGPIPSAFEGTDVERQTASAPAGAVDPATEILAVQMGSNTATVVVDIAVARLDGAIPTGAQAQRWDVTWSDGARTISAYAQRTSGGPTFGYRVGDVEAPTSGSLDRIAGIVRILVPRHEIGADDVTRFTGIVARSSLAAGAVQDTRDTAPNTQTWATQYVAGASCADQARAACPVVLDVAGDAGPVVDHEGRTVPEPQPASDFLAAGAAGPAGTLVLSAKVLDLSGPIPQDYDRQGWTISWTHRGIRYVAQAERTASDVVFRVASLGAGNDDSRPAGPVFTNTVQATGTIDVQTGIVRIVVGRDQVGDPADGETLRNVGAQSWIMSSGKITDGAYMPAPHLNVDATPVAPYRTGLGCGV